MTDEKFRIITECETEVPKPCCLVIFGASGDLTKRKLIPSLYRLYHHGRLPRNFFVYGLGRTEMDSGPIPRFVADLNGRNLSR